MWLKLIKASPVLLFAGCSYIDIQNIPEIPYINQKQLPSDLMVVDFDSSKDSQSIYLPIDKDVLCLNYINTSDSGMKINISSYDNKYISPYDNHQIDKIIPPRKYYSYMCFYIDPKFWASSIDKTSVKFNIGLNSDEIKAKYNIDVIKAEQEKF